MKKRDKVSQTTRTKKSYKAFRQEVNRNKIREDRAQKAERKRCFEQISYNNLEEIEELI